MNIIIVAKSLGSPRKFALRDPRFIASSVLVVGFLLGLGAVLGYFLRGSNGKALDELAQLRSTLGTQQSELGQAQQQVDREINALGLRLGELQANSTRLNALGDRLTHLAQLDDGEFDFSMFPAMGGPESDDDLLGAPSDRSVRASLDALAVRMEAQSRQLGVLESLLLDRELETALLPAGLPVRAGYASSGFGVRSDPFTGYNAFHKGIDFSGLRGSDVLAVADGVVVFSGRHSSYGNMIDVDHGNGYVTRYAHNQKNLVEQGHRVRAGDVIAQMGNTGRATGVHVHFEVWLNDRPVNPSAYLKKALGRG